MKNKKLLSVILLSLILCFVSGAEYGVGLEKDSVSTTQTEQTWAESLKARIQASQAPERYTFLVVWTDQEDIRYTLSMLESFLDIYADPEIPEEFSWIFPTGIRAFLERSDLRPKVKEYSWIPSLLLTMAYQQGYEIEHVTSSYVILVKPVYEEELKE